MKKFIALACMLTLALLFVLETAAQEKTEQLWLAEEEIVKPEMIDQYHEVSKELVELCKAENFPYTFYLYSYQPFHYKLWYPIEEMNDISKIEDAWDAIIEKYGADKFNALRNALNHRPTR
jgi:hypothetical protein